MTASPNLFCWPTPDDCSLLIMLGDCGVNYNVRANLELAPKPTAGV